jgi:4-hydroxybenzoate polyprenyltransferase
MDGTLLATDTLWESVLILLKTRPWKMLLLPAWLLRGKAYFKHQVARSVELDPAVLPYRGAVLDFLKSERDSGREIVLATAGDRTVAERVANYLGIASAVLASDGKTNLAGRQKLDALRTYLGSREFDYIGNAEADLPLWQAASEMLLVQPSAGLLRKVQRIGPVGRIFASRASLLRSTLQALRVRQWVKNVLLFVPLLTSHRVTEPAALLSVAVASLAFSFCASAVYVVNDLLDLESDRHHPTKRFRPFAAGMLPIPTGLILVPLLLGCSLALAAFLLPPLFMAVLGLYLVAATAYSVHMKRVVGVDVLVLAGLYALRVYAGGVAASIPISQWLLEYSMYFFVSLAILKRYSEVSNVQARGGTDVKGRGYLPQDQDLLRAIGVTSGYLSVLVFALYVNSREAEAPYHHPQALWMAIPLLLYWITRIWFLAHRREIDEDPVVFAVRDPVSYIVGGLVGLVIVAAL